MLALAAANHGGQHLHALAFGVGHHLLHHLVDGLLFDLLAALGAVRHAHAGVEQTQVIVDFRHRAHRGTRVARRGFLVDGDGGTEAVDGVDIGLFHLAQEHARIAGQAFHIAALAFGIDGIESEAGFARAAHAGKHHQLIARDFQIHIFQVMFARTANDEFILQGDDSFLREAARVRG